MAAFGASFLPQRWLIFSFLAFLRLCEASYVVTLELGDSECFIIRAPDQAAVVRYVCRGFAAVSWLFHGVSLSLSWSQIDSLVSITSGNYDILNDMAEGSVFRARIDMVDAPHDTLWKSEDKQTEERFSVPIKAKQRVELCLDLDQSVDDDTVEDKGLPVGFNLYVSSAVERTLPEGEDGPDSKRALQLLEQADQIRMDWNNLLDHFDFLRNRCVEGSFRFS